MDDNFMTVFFNDDLECTEYVLRVILEIPDLKVTESKSQYTIANLKGKLPLYHIDRTIRELNSPFDDKSHIIYVNGEYRGDNPIGNLLHDFSCRNADDMKSAVLANKTRLLKENEQGVKRMCRAVEELIEEDRIETALKMLVQKRIKEEELSVFFAFSQKQVEQVLSLYHDRTPANA